MAESRAVQTTAAIRLLGRFDVLVDDTPIDDTAWRGRKAQQLVKLLAVSAGRSLHREQIADALWPDLDADAADRQLHKAIHAARRAFEPGLTAGAESLWLLTQDRSVALSPALTIDADDAEVAAETALSSRDLNACILALERFSGALLPADLYDSWSEPRRSRLGGLHSRLLAAVAEGAVSSARFEQAEDAAQQLLAIDVTDERAYRVLMEVSSQSGDRSAVARHFRTCESALASELGVEPSETTRALYEQLMERSATPASGAFTLSGGTELQPVSSSIVHVESETPGQAVFSRRRGFIVAALVAAVALGVTALPRVRSFVWGGSPAGLPVTAVSAKLPWAFVRVSVDGSASSWAAFTDSEGRFLLRDTTVRSGDSITLVVDGDGAESRVATLRVPGGDETGIADLGAIDVSAMQSIKADTRRAMDGSQAFDRNNLEWYRGVAAAVTAGSSTDQERVTALHAFVAGRYARPADNGPVETPRRTIEIGTLFSGPLPVAMATLTHAAGYETRLVAISAPRPVDMEHTVVEVFYDGRWHLFDPAFGVVAVNDLGEIANHEDLVRHPALIDRMPYAAAARPGWRGAEIPMLLRSGVHRVTGLGPAIR